MDINYCKQFLTRMLRSHIIIKQFFRHAHQKWPPADCSATIYHQASVRYSVFADRGDSLMKFTIISCRQKLMPLTFTAKPLWYDSLSWTLDLSVK